jgi:hypothetical protein
MIILEKDQEKMAMEELEKVLRIEIEKKFKNNISELTKSISVLSKYIMILGAICSAYAVNTKFSKQEIESNKKIISYIMKEMGVNNITDIPDYIDKLVDADKERELMLMDTVGGVC